VTNRIQKEIVKQPLVFLGRHELLELFRCGVVT
jgi:hypothetical protein